MDPDLAHNGDPIRLSLLTILGPRFLILGTLSPFSPIGSELRIEIGIRNKGSGENSAVFTDVADAFAFGCFCRNRFL